MNDAKKSINYCTSAAGLVRAYKAHSESLESAKIRGARVRFLTQISTENSGVARQLGEVVDLKRLEKPFATNFVSVDSEELIVLESKPDDLRTDRGSDLAIWTTNKLLIELHEQMFERIWNTLPVTKER
jgi:hypothetical protein